MLMLPQLVVFDNWVTMSGIFTTQTLREKPNIAIVLLSYKSPQSRLCLFKIKLIADVYHFCKTTKMYVTGRVVAVSSGTSLKHDSNNLFIFIFNKFTRKL